MWGLGQLEARKATKVSTSVNAPEVYCQSKIHRVHPITVRQKLMVEHRQEQRARRDLAVQVSGRDSNGTAFTQSVTASNISRSGALLSGYLGEYDPGTCYGWNTKSEKLDSELCG